MRGHGSFLAATAPPREPGLPSPSAIRSPPRGGQPEPWAPETQSTKERLEILVEPLLPSPLLVIVGGGHIGQALAVQATLVGLRSR